MLLEELKGDVGYLAWLPDPSAPNDQIHHLEKEQILVFEMVFQMI